MLKLNYTFFKSLSLILFFALCATGCGSTPTPQDYFDSIDLSTDTVVIDVPLPTTQTDEELKRDMMENPEKWIPTKTTSSPVEFSKIKKIWMITKDASGEKKLIATSTVQDNVNGSRGVNITQIEAIETGDRIWLTDAKNDSEYVAHVQFSQSPSIGIAVYLVVNGSTSFSEIYKNEPVARFYIHFERK